MKNEMVASQNGVTIEYTGEQLTQTDLDVGFMILLSGSPLVRSSSNSIAVSFLGISSIQLYRSNKGQRMTSPTSTG